MASEKKKIALTLQEQSSKKPHWAYKLGKKRSQAGGPGKSTEEPPDKRGVPAEGGTSSAGSTEAMAEEGVANPDAMDTDDVHSRTRRSTTGGTTSSSSASGLRGTVQWPDGLPLAESKQEQSYHRDYTFRLSSAPIQYKTLSGTNGVGTVVKFPVFEFPYWSSGFCLSEEELGKILQETTKATVKSIAVKIYCKTATLPFATNVSTAGIGNNNIGVQIMQFRKDINKYRKGRYIFADDIMNKCWGGHLSSLNVSNDWSEDMHTLGAECVTRNWDSRFEFDHEHSGTPLWNDGGNGNTYSDHLFPWRQFCTNFRNATFEEGLYDEFIFKPNKGTFHCQTRISDNMSLDDGNIGLCKRTFPTVYNNQTKNSKVVPPYQIGGYAIGKEWVTTDTCYKIPSSRFQYTKTGAATIPFDDCDLAEIPCLSIGIDPIYNGDIATLKGKLVNVNLDVRVQVVTIIEEVRGTNYQFRFGGNLVQKDPKFGIWRNMYMTVGSGQHYHNIITHNTNNINTYSKMARVENQKEKSGDQMKIDLSYNGAFRSRPLYKENDYIEDHYVEATADTTSKGMKYNLRQRKFKLGKPETATVQLMTKASKADEYKSDKTKLPSHLVKGNK
uniref:Capsid protein n=1 Tax=Atrato Denso-like virus 1 TaxID=2689333 RepID=A0A6B9KLK6_9VIRU|nr:hypothetical protein [Atrato Denso-like virus 1]